MGYDFYVLAHSIPVTGYYQFWFIQVESTDFPEGEIRGQLQHQDSFFARLKRSSLYPLPAHTGICENNHAECRSLHVLMNFAASTGLLTAVYSKWNPEYYITFDVSHNVHSAFLV